MSNYPLMGGSILAVVLLVLVSFTSVVGLQNTRSDYCYPDFGEPNGQNGWYVLPLIVTFIYNPENVTEIQSWLNMSWVPYNGPFNITEKAELFPFKWRYKTIENESKWIYDQVNFPSKIDSDNPSVSTSIHRKGFFLWKKYIVDAIVCDKTSGIEYVEFYLNGQLRFKATGAPWEWILYPVPCRQNLLFKVIAYDEAGHSNEDQVLKSNIYSKGFHP